MRTDAEAAARGGGAEHDREATRRPNTARPRWNGSTNTRTHTAAAPPSPTAPAAPAAPAPAAASPRKWKTPFQRALERVRTPRKVDPPPAQGSSIYIKKRHSRTLSDSDESSNECSDRRPSDRNERGCMLVAPAHADLESQDCKLWSQVVSTKIVNILGPDTGASSPCAASTGPAERERDDARHGRRAEKEDGLNAQSSAGTGRAGPGKPNAEEGVGRRDLASVLQLNKALEQEAQQKERAAMAAAAKLEEVALALFQKEAERSRLEEENKRLQLAAQQASLDIACAHDQVAALHEKARAHASLNGSGATRVEMSTVLSDANDLLRLLQDASSRTASGPMGTARTAEWSVSDRSASMSGARRSFSAGLESSLLGAAHDVPDMSTEGWLNDSELSSIRRERAQALDQIPFNVPESADISARSGSVSRTEWVSTTARKAQSPATSAAALYSTSAPERSLRTSSGRGSETAPWVLSVQVQQARNLPPQRHESETEWISCALAVSTGCRTAQHLFSTSAVARRSVQWTDKCPRTSNPTWNQHFDFTSVASCDADCECAVRHGSSGRGMCSKLDGAAVTLVIGLYDHTEDGNDDPVGSVVLPARPGADAVDWYILQSRAGFPVRDRTGNLSYVKIRVSYTCRREIGVEAGWPGDWATCIPVHSSSSVITLVEPGELACGISMLLDEPRLLKTSSNSSARGPDEAASFVDDLCSVLNVRAHRIKFCGILRDRNAIATFNINPAHSQSSPRELALALCNMVGDPSSPLRQARSTRACFRILVHAPIVDEAADPSEILAPVTNRALFLPRAALAAKVSGVDSDLHPVTVRVLFGPPPSANANKPTASGADTRAEPTPRVLATSHLGREVGADERNSVLPVTPKVGTRSALSVPCLPLVDGQPEQAPHCSPPSPDGGEILGLVLEHPSPILQAKPTPRKAASHESQVGLAPERSTSSLSLPNGSLTDRSHRSSPSQDRHDRVQGRWRLAILVQQAKELVRLRGSGIPNLHLQVAVVKPGDNFYSASACNTAGSKFVHEDVNPYFREMFTFYELHTTDGLKNALGDPVDVIVVVFDRNGDQDDFRGSVRIHVAPGFSIEESWQTIEHWDGSRMYGPSGTLSQIQVSVNYAKEPEDSNLSLASSPRTPGGPWSSTSTAGLRGQTSKAPAAPPLAPANSSPSPPVSGGLARYLVPPALAGKASPRCDASSRSSTSSTPTQGRRFEEALL